MPSRAPGPYLLDIPILTSGEIHHMTFNCDTIGDPEIGSLPADVSMRTKGAGPTPLDDSANALWAAMRPLYNTTSLAPDYVLWKIPGPNLDKTFISGGSLTTPNGSSASPAKLTYELICTFRSGGGNIGKVVFPEDVVDSEARGPLGGGLFGETVAVKAYLLSSANIVMARDRSFPVAGLSESSGPNRKLVTRRYRS